MNTKAEICAILRDMYARIEQGEADIDAYDDAIRLIEQEVNYDGI